MSNIKNLMMVAAGGEPSWLALGQQNLSATILNHNTAGTLTSEDTQAGTDLLAVFSNGGDYLLTRDSGTSTAEIYSFSGGVIGSLVDSFSVGTSPNAAMFSPNDDYILFGTFSSSDGIRVYSWNGSSASLVATAGVSSVGVSDVDWHPDGDELVAASSWSNRAYMFSFNGSSLSSLGTTILSGAAAVAYSPDGSQVSVGGSGAINTYDVTGSSFGSSSTLSSTSSNEQLCYITNSIVARSGGFAAFGNGTVSTFSASPSASSFIDGVYVESSTGAQVDGAGLDVTNDGAYLVAGAKANGQGRISLYPLDGSGNFGAIADTFDTGGTVYPHILCFSNGRNYIKS